jgi:uncharacterized RDD family membrane protein YckC
MYGAQSQYPPFGANQPPVRYAGWWRRVGATLIDWLIFWLFWLPGYIALFVGPTRIDVCDNFSGEASLCDVPTGGTVLVALLLMFVGFVVYVVIYARMLGHGATFGRKAAGYRVLDERTMEPIGTGRAVGRFFATYLSAMPFYLGFLWPLWDSENRTFHDMIVRTRAVRTP